MLLNNRHLETFNTATVQKAESWNMFIHKYTVSVKNFNPKKNIFLVCHNRDNFRFIVSQSIIIKYYMHSKLLSTVLYRIIILNSCSN